MCSRGGVGGQALAGLAALVLFGHWGVGCWAHALARADVCVVPGGAPLPPAMRRAAAAGGCWAGAIRGSGRVVSAAQLPALLHQG